MACLIIEVIMILGGLYALVTARFSLTDRFYLPGWKARIVGLVWMSPLPVTFSIGLATGVLIVLGVFPKSVMDYVGWVEPIAVIGAVVGSLVLAYATE